MDIIALIIFAAIAIAVKKANTALKDADTSEYDERNSRKASLQQVKTKTVVKNQQKGYQAPATPITKPVAPIAAPIMRYDEPAAEPVQSEPVQMPLPFVRDEAGEKVGLERKPLEKKPMQAQGSMPNTSKEGRSKPLKPSGEGETFLPDFKPKPKAEPKASVPTLHLCGKEHIELTPQSMRNLFIMKEILDRPLAMRNKSAR